jgi:phage-related protein
MIQPLKQCIKEIDMFPEDVRGEIADALARLEEGHLLCFPLSRPMPGIGSGVHELRFRDRNGIYRIIYYLAGAKTIWLLHAFVKKTSTTPKHHIDVAQDRLRRIFKS